MTPGMGRLAKLATATAVAACLSATSALGQSVHLKPPNRNPSFTDLGLALQAAGNLAGLGNGDVVVTLTAQADVTAVCANRGRNEPPGQNPAPITVTGAQAIPEEEIKNGNVSFNVQTRSPVTPIPGAPDCPNPNWTESITDLAFTSALIVVEQGMQVVLEVSCVFASPTDNGAVPSAEVTCEVS
ncbi:MAG: hypothetical protein AB1689_05055 [Thermodesulfobacteriota bacterium]